MRTEVNDGTSAAWLQLPRPEATNRICLSPLGVHELHVAVAIDLGVHSQGLRWDASTKSRAETPFTQSSWPGRWTTGPSNDGGVVAPATLTDVVRSRLGGPEPDVHEALLAAACMATPTVELVSRATIGDNDQLVYLLEISRGQGHYRDRRQPDSVCASPAGPGVYTEAVPAGRRLMQSEPGRVVDESELRARHLALAATSGDDVTLRALDTLAESARARGAPAAAAELMDLAIGLGGDAPERRLRSALHHFDRGYHERAAVLQETVDGLTRDLRAEALCRLAVVRLYTEGFFEATTVLQQALDDADEGSPLRVLILITLAYSLMHANQIREGKDTAQQAVSDAERLNQPHFASVSHWACGSCWVSWPAKVSTMQICIGHWSWRTSRPPHRWFSGPACSTRYCWSSPAN